MWAFVATWWPVLVLVHLPDIALVFAVTAYKRVKGRLDHAIPDTLPETAGGWLDAELAAINLTSHVRVITVDQQRNAYHPRTRTIVLDTETYFKRDPVYWAIAAHELGHAHFKVTRPRLAIAFDVGRRIKSGLTTLGLGLALCNTLFGLPGVTTAAFVCLVVALVLCGFDLVDEIVASRFAMRALRKNAALTPTHLVAVRTTLMFALLTYLTAFAALAVLLTQWSVIVHMTTSHVRVPSTLTSFGHGVVVAASVICFLYPVSTIVFALRGRRNWLLVLVRLLWGFAFPLVVWLLWDLRTDTAYAWCGLLATLPLAPAVVVLARVLLGVISRYFRHLGRLLEGPGIETSAAYRADVRAGATKTRAGNTDYEAMRKTYAARPIHVWSRLYAMLYLPLLIVYWLT